MRLIDAGKLLEHIKDLPTWWADAGGVYGKSMKYPSGMFDCEDVVGSIEDAPTVDAVVVTRCKDCRYRGLICCPAVHETMCNGLVDYAVDNGYCWCGKQKED